MLTNNPAQKPNPLERFELGLGAWQWGDRITWNFGKNYGPDDLRETFHIALADGVRLIDTAEIYGSGSSERVLGSLLHDTEAEVYVATKYFPWPWRLGAGAQRRALNGSLLRLGLKRVDLYQIHFPNPVRSIEATMESLVPLVQEGRIGAVGVSNFNESQMIRAYTTLARHGIPLSSNQVAYSLLHRAPEKNGLLKRCQELGIRVIAYSPLEMGILTGKYSAQNLPEGVRGIRYQRLVQRIGPLIALMTEVGQDHGNRSAAQVALNWTMRKGTLPIPGAKTAAQAHSNMGALGWELTASEMQVLEDASERVYA